MKLITTISLFAAAAVALASCEIQSEDAFSTSPEAPILNAHSDILLTEGTMAEDIEFTWSAARFIDFNDYSLSVSYNEDTVVVSTTSELFYKDSKTNFKSFLDENLNLPENATVSLKIMVEVTDINTGIRYISDVKALNVYNYGNAVAPVAVADSLQIVLDKSNPQGAVALLAWDPARLVYGQKVTYSVAISSPKSYVLASGLETTAFSMTVDALNEAVIAAGGAENAVTEVGFTVTAYCESIPGGIVSEQIIIPVTTYMATFPDKMYLPGSHQKWDIATAPVIAHSTVVKGFYEGLIDLTTTDGSDVEFKFSPKGEWGEDFSIGNITVTSFSEKYSYVKGSGIASENIKVPSGLYSIILNKKMNTLDMVQVETLSLIGAAFNDPTWSTDVDMIYDAASKTFFAEVSSITTEGEFKIRTNHDWSHSIGGELTNASYNLTDNFKAPVKDGQYKVVLNCSKNPYTVTFVDMNMPDVLVIAGDYSGHKWNGSEDAKVYLKDIDKGIYKGYVTMYNPTYGFKVVRNGTEWFGGALIGSAGGIYTYDLSSTNGNMMLPEGNGTYYWEIDMVGMTAKMAKMDDSKIGIIGMFEGCMWDKTITMTFDEATLTYHLRQDFKIGNEFKFRFNDNWSYNLGCKDGNDMSLLIHDGGNYKVTSAGTYEIVLDLAKTANATLN